MASKSCVFNTYYALLGTFYLRCSVSCISCDARLCGISAERYGVAADALGALPVTLLVTFTAIQHIQMLMHINKKIMCVNLSLIVLNWLYFQGQLADYNIMWVYERYLFLGLFTPLCGS